MISNVLRAGLTSECLTFDLWYNARLFTKWLNAEKVIWVSTLMSHALITTPAAPSRSRRWAQQLARQRIAGRT